MSLSRACRLFALVAVLVLPARSAAQSPQVDGPLVTVSVEVAGRSAPLYAAPDGSNRWYLEAREGSAYSLTVTNRSAERLGVVVAVDGLNAISGERQRWPTWWRASDPGRLYVLEPWGAATVQGWRTSLDEVRRFTFVDEKVSYAARSGKSNDRMGWIEIAVFRERERHAVVTPDRPTRVSPEGQARAGDERGGPAQAPEPSPGAAPTDRAQGASDRRAAEKEADRASAGSLESRARSYPGTGWGPEAEDPVIVVEFEPERRPSQRVTLRYEYAPALIELGILPRQGGDRGRLAERERGELGFAPMPLW
jgi:hypothetical protein